MAYWREIRAEAWNQTKTGLASSQRRKTSVVVPIISAFIGLATLHLLHQPIPLTLFVGLISALLAFGLVVLWEWLWRMIHLVPETHAANLRTIETLNAIIGELSRRLETPRAPPPPDPITVRIQDAQWGTPRPLSVEPNVLEVSVRIQIRNAGSPTTLDDWALKSEQMPQLTSRLIGFQLGSPDDPNATDVRSHQMAQGGTVAGSVEFRITGLSLAEAKEPSLAWFLEFSDTSNKLYKVEIPAHYYPPYR